MVCELPEDPLETQAPTSWEIGTPTGYPTFLPTTWPSEIVPAEVQCRNEFFESARTQPWYRDDLPVEQYPVKFQFQWELCVWIIEKADYSTEVQECIDKVFASVPDQPWYNDLSVTEYPQEYWSQWDSCVNAAQSPTESPAEGAADDPSPSMVSEVVV